MNSFRLFMAFTIFIMLSSIFSAPAWAIGINLDQLEWERKQREFEWKLKQQEWKLQEQQRKFEMQQQKWEMSNISSTFRDYSFSTLIRIPQPPPIPVRQYPSSDFGQVKRDVWRDYFFDNSIHLGYEYLLNLSFGRTAANLHTTYLETALENRNLPNILPEWYEPSLAESNINYLNRSWF